MVKILIGLILGIICGFLYRLGGWEKGNKLFRRLGCPALALGLYLWLKGGSLCFWWAYLLSFGLSVGAISTYNDWITDGDENWLCWLMTGAIYSLAMFPLLWIGINWYALFIRTFVLSLGTMFIREFTGNDFIEEFGTGFLYLTTIPLLMI